MKNITKILALILAASMSCMVMTSCGRSKLDTEGLTDGEPLVMDNGEIPEEEIIDEDDDEVKEKEDKKTEDKEDIKEEKTDKDAKNKDTKEDSKKETEKKTTKSSKKASADKYNKGRVNVTGKTVGEIAKQMGKDFDQFLADNGLPADMHEDTYESVAAYYRPVQKVAEDAGATLEELKMMFGLDDIDPDDTWGEVYDRVTLDKVVGADAFENFKKEMGLGDEVTLDTKWGEIRNTVEKKQKEQNEKLNQ